MVALFPIGLMVQSSQLIFSVTNRTDLDTADPQAVDGAEYDDGFSTDSEWSDDSVESNSD